MVLQDICPFDAPGYSGAEFPGGNVTGFCPPANFQASPSAYREDSFGHGAHLFFPVLLAQHVKGI